MKGTQAHPVRAASAQLDVAPHHVDNIDACQKILNERLRNHAFGVWFARAVLGSQRYQPSRALTKPETLPKSARPASFGLRIAMIRPISAIPSAAAPSL